MFGTFFSPRLCVQVPLQRTTRLIAMDLFTLLNQLNPKWRQRSLVLPQRCVQFLRNRFAELSRLNPSNQVDMRAGNFDREVQRVTPIPLPMQSYARQVFALAFAENILQLL